MKRVFRFITAAVAALLCSVTAVNAADSYFELNGFAFSINDEGKAAVRDYSGSDTDVTIPDKLLSAPVIGVGDYAFYSKPITSVSFEAASQLSSIGVCAFYNCASLSELSIPSDIALSFGAFQNCTALESLSIGEGIGTIPEQCFYGCSSLSEVTLPDSITEIGTRAFGECDSLHYVYLSDTVDTIAPGAFEGSDQVVIRCERESYAAAYAKENSIRAEYPYSYKIGDANGDGLISMFDVTALQRLMAHMEDDPDGLLTLRGCVTGGTLSAVDITLIQRYLAHMSVPYPIDQTAWGYTSAETV
ncbi:MAG: leucine-rich repeat protein [Ruminococcus sp.]|nr:leucine-rich repeat protein [Ruminococcus sp.]